MHLRDGTVARARAVVIATGVAYRRLDAPGVEELLGSGVYYGSALSEATACTDKVVFVVGAGNSAGQAALHLVRFARRVVIVARRRSLAFSMSHYLVERLEAEQSVEVLTSTTVEKAVGAGRLERLVVRDHVSQTEVEVDAHALFVMIGGDPHTEWLEGIVRRDERGYIVTGSTQSDLSSEDAHPYQSRKDCHGRPRKPPRPSDQSALGAASHASCPHTEEVHRRVAPRTPEDARIAPW